MFTTVVAAIDGDAGGRDALALARELAEPQGTLALTNIYLAGALPARGSAGPFTAGQRRESHELLERAAREAGIEAKLYPVASPYVGRGLHHLAESAAADLLVVGSSRHGMFGRVLLGDDMRAALNGAPCAVAVAPRGYADESHALSEIGVGYDGSPEAQAALEMARQLAAEHGARLSAFEAVTPQRLYAESRFPTQQTLDREIQEAYERLEGLEGVEPHAAYGDPAEELALYAASVDLLVVGSRGYGPLGRLVHGSTSLRLAHSARCPLLVLTRSAARRTDAESDAPAETAAPAGA